jgi:hypothetical protein
MFTNIQPKVRRPLSLHARRRRPLAIGTHIVLGSVQVPDFHQKVHKRHGPDQYLQLEFFLFLLPLSFFFSFRPVIHQPRFSAIAHILVIVLAVPLPLGTIANRNHGSQGSKRIIDLCSSGFLNYRMIELALGLASCAR